MIEVRFRVDEGSHSMCTESVGGLVLELIGAGREGGEYVLNGHKWWASGAMDPRCAIGIFMGKTDPGAAAHKQQSMILVPLDAPGVKIVRALTVFGYDDAPHGHAEVIFKVRRCGTQLDFPV